MSKRFMKITDHAVVRYLERVHGTDVESIRDMLSAKLEPYAKAGARWAEFGDLYFLLAGNALVTVLPQKPDLSRTEAYQQGLDPDEDIEYRDRQRHFTWSKGKRIGAKRHKPEQ